MKNIFTKKQGGFFLLILFTAISVTAQKQTNERAEWFVNDRFGMFIHWGIYSGAEGFWKGEKLRHNNDYAEWIMYRNQISKKEYLSLLDRFRWDEIDPEEWVILAKKSGMKYVTITAKHHDGFALWDSQVSDFDLGDYTNPKRDIVKELAEACRKHGMEMGIYYSHWVDWEHPYGWDHSKEITGISPEKYDLYWQEKVIPQVRELLTNYGEIGMIWFDMWIHHSETVVTKDQLLQLKNMIRELQPDCIINSRLGLSIEEDPDVDFKTLGDNQLGSNKEEFPWQSPATVAHSWGFHALDTEWKSTTTLLKSLINNVSLNGNFMLNIGPRANGEVPYEISARMLEMGRWLEVNGEAVYGAGAVDLRKDLHDWGRITRTRNNGRTKLFLHVYNWPLNRKLGLTGIKTTPVRVYLLADKEKSPLKVVHSGVYTEISLPELDPDPYITVVVAEYNQPAETEKGLVAKTTSGGFSLTPQNSSSLPEGLIIREKSRYGTVPEHAEVLKPSALSWKIYIDSPGTKTIDVSYSYQGEKEEGQLVIEAAGETLSHQILPAGKTVGEPNSNWIIDRYESNDTGKIDFPEEGIYEIKLRVLPPTEEAVKFQWIWIE